LATAFTDNIKDTSCLSLRFEWFGVPLKQGHHGRISDRSLQVEDRGWALQFWCQTHIRRPGKYRTTVG
jgi:hypothetical protein